MIVNQLVPGGMPWPTLALAMEPTVLALWTLTAAAFALRRFQQDSGGILAACVLTGLACATAWLPADVALFADVFTPEFGPSRWRWTALAAIGCVGWSLAVRDQALPLSRRAGNLYLRMLGHTPRRGLIVSVRRSNT